MTAWRGTARRLLAGTLLGGTVALLTLADGGLAATEPASPGSEDTVLRAMRDELARSMSGLRLEGMEPPYYIEYTVVDVQAYKLTAVLGAVEKEEGERQRWLSVGLRVGSREFDNTGFVSNSSSYDSNGNAGAWLPVEDDYDALRREIWLATDQAFKRALGTFAAKRAAFANRKRDELPDLSTEAPQISLSAATAATFDPAPWRERVRALSAIHRAYPEIQESGTSLRVHQAVRYYVNSEGTVVRRPAGRALFLAGVLTQAADGMPIYATVTSYQRTVSEIPSEERLAVQVRASAERVKALVAAPAPERYVGPVLLAPEAGAQLLALTLLPALSGERPPVADDERASAYFRPGAFSGRIGRRVLPAFLNVEDDPLKSELDGQGLFGSYALDDQGVPARRLSLVENGILQSLLMSRRPGYGILQSNGHGRSVGGGVSSRATAGNMIVTAAEGKTLAELKKDLIELCRNEGLERGLLITSIGLPLAAELQSSLMALLMGGGGEGGVKLAATAASLISVADGREEPVRGLMTGELTPRALLSIAAAGKERHVFNFLGVDDGTVMGMISSFVTTLTDETENGVPISVAGPALLFPELEFNQSTAPQEKLTLTVRPLLR